LNTAVINPSKQQTLRMMKTIKKSVSAIVPENFKRERAIFRRMYPGARRLYAILRVSNLLGLRNYARAPIPSHAKQFLFVCYGNIMRSPLAEALFRKYGNEQHLPIQACSAGLHAIEGTPADIRAQHSATGLGISLANHRARLLTSDMTQEADIIFVMDVQNLAELTIRFPNSRGKVHLLSAVNDRRLELREIPDPFFGDTTAMQRSCSMIASSITRLVDQVKRSGMVPTGIKGNEVRHPW
jgi:protein-tyrosine phosphatase